MKSKKEKLQITALAAAASILLTGAGTPQAQNTNNIENTNRIDTTIELNTEKELKDLGVEIPKNKVSNIVRNELLLMRINQYILNSMKNLNNVDEKTSQVVDFLTKLIKNSKIKITGITYKYNHNGTHTITTNYVNKETGEKFTKTQTDKCSYEKNSNKCQICEGIKRTHTSSSSSSSNSHTHNYIEISKELIFNENGTHTVTTTYECPKDKVTKTTNTIENCTFGEIMQEEVNGETKEYQICKVCNGKYYIPEHIHTNSPTDIQYTVISSNEDGTHNLEGTYTCSECNEEVTITLTESCEYIENEKEIEKIEPSNFAITNTHLEVMHCTKCNSEYKKEVSCVPNDKKEFMGHLSQIYEYYTCEICGNRCEQYPHEHKYNGETYENNTTIEHKEVCFECKSGIIASKHDWTLSEDGTVATCYICNDSMPVQKHTHLPNNIGLMDLISSEEYKTGNVSKSQTLNPNPSYDDYCSAYEVNCKNCNGFYLSKRDHSFKDGVCTRNGCGIVDPNYTPTTFEETTNETEEKTVENYDEITYSTYENAYNPLEENNYSKKLIKSH